MINVVNALTYIIDDDYELHEIIQDVLIEYGVKKEDLRFFVDPELFINSINDELNICVLDHRMPGYNDGIDYVKRIKAKNKYSFVIVMSGYRNIGTGIKYINAGADKYIDKNWSKEEILEILGDNWDFKKTGISFISVLVRFLREGIEETKKRLEFIRFLEKRLKYK